MKEIIFEKQGTQPVLNTSERPIPGETQILVKSLWTAMNPVDAFVGDLGLLVEQWPAGLGADASGVVAEVGTRVKSFKVGDYVCGCTRIGAREYSTCREYFLMDEQVTMRRPTNLSLAEAATIGAAMQTASFGVFQGLSIKEPEGGKAVQQGNPWVLILGGAGSVGRAGVQLAHVSGCRVIASCSEKSFAAVKAIGADAVFDYHLSLEEQLKAIKAATNAAPVIRIFDATSADDPVLAKTLFREQTGTKLFSTTNDWSGVGEFEGGKTTEIHLGLLGRPNAPHINDPVEKWNAMIVSLFEAGILKPMPHEVIGGTGGLEDAIRGYNAKASSKKLVVKLQEE